MKTVLTLNELDAIVANAETKVRDGHEHCQARGMTITPHWLTSLETYCKEMTKLRDTAAATKQVTK